jgi:hypothetical protein
MPKTIITLAEEAKRESVKKLLQDFEGSWFYSNDTSRLYYYLVNVEEVTRFNDFLVCDGKKIVDRVYISFKNMQSFEPITHPGILESLQLVFTKSLLSGVYKPKRIHIGWGQFGRRLRAGEENIMNGTVKNI